MKTWKKPVGIGVAIVVATMLAMMGVLALEGRLGQAGSQLFGDAPEEVKPTPSDAAPSSPRAANALSLFQLPAPLDANELLSLQNELKNSHQRYLELNRTLEEKLLEIEVREKTLEGRWQELQDLRKAIESQARELAVRSSEFRRDLEAYEVAEEKAYKNMAKALVDMKPDEAAATLMASEDLTRAASVLSHLPADAQGAILQAMDETDRKQLLPLWRKIETSKGRTSRK